MTDQVSYPVPFAGRDIRFRRPIAGQLIILRRRLLRLQEKASQTTDEQERLQLSNQLVIDTLNVVESLIVNPEDAEFLENAMLMGKVGHEEVMAVLGMKFEDPQPVKATKNTAKTTAKTATKTTANRGRTKR